MNSANSVGIRMRYRSIILVLIFLLDYSAGHPQQSTSSLPATVPRVDQQAASELLKSFNEKSCSVDPFACRFPGGVSPRIGGVAQVVPYCNLDPKACSDALAERRKP